jgi:hypothetical protein
MDFDIILNGQDEFYENVNNKTYNILKVDNIQKENFMCNIFRKFIKNLETNPKEKHYIGIDFEFKQVRKEDRDVALMQLNLENSSNDAYIFICYPPDMTKDNLQILIAKEEENILSNAQHLRHLVHLLNTKHFMLLMGKI